MTKFALTAVLFFALATITYGQNKVEKYCEVTSDHFTLKKRTVTISFGDENPMPTDTAENKIIKFIRTKNKFKSDVDILNYMSSQGWSLKSSCVDETVNGGTSFGPTFIFYFEKIIENN
ncbi:MAG TPA: hypothetical protein VIJ95_17955 [Hanamia sp.]